MPRIDSISTKSGGSNGNVLTIKGVGFSSKQDNNIVKIGDLDCAVL